MTLRTTTDTEKLALYLDQAALHAQGDLVDFLAAARERVRWGYYSTPERAARLLVVLEELGNLLGAVTGEDTRRLELVRQIDRATAEASRNLPPTPSE